MERIDGIEFDPNQKVDWEPGLGMSPFPTAAHQLAIHRLVEFFNQKLPKTKYIALHEKSVEMERTDGLGPDVLVYEKRKKTPENPTGAVAVVLVEVHRSVAANTTEKKLFRLLNENREVQECFAFDYEEKTWFRLIRKDDGYKKQETNKSNYLKLTIKTPKLTLF